MLRLIFLIIRWLLRQATPAEMRYRKEYRSTYASAVKTGMSPANADWLANLDAMDRTGYRPPMPGAPAARDDHTRSVDALNAPQPSILEHDGELQILGKVLDSQWDNRCLVCSHDIPSDAWEQVDQQTEQVTLLSDCAGCGSGIVATFVRDRDGESDILYVFAGRSGGAMIT